MKQIGVVFKTYGNTAEVYIKRPTACGGECRKCAGCETTSEKAVAINNKGAKVGDTVILEMQDSQVLKAAFFIYIIPLMIFFIGFFIGNSIYNSQYIGVLLGGISLGAYTIILRRIDNNLSKSKKYKSQITQIIS